MSEDSNNLKLSKVKEIIGGIDSEIIENLSNSIINNDYIEVINIVDNLVVKGKDLRQMVYELTENFLEKLISAEDKNLYASIIDELSSLDEDIRTSINPVIIVKATLIKITQGKIEKNLGNVTSANIDNSKINELQQDIIKIKNYLASNKKENIRPVNNVNNNAPRVKGNFTNGEELKKKMTELGKLKLFSAMSGAIFKNEEEFIIISNNEFAAKMLASEKAQIAEVLKQEYGIDKQIVIKYNKVESSSKMEKILKDSNTEYTEM